MVASLQAEAFRVHDGQAQALAHDLSRAVGRQKERVEARVRGRQLLRIRAIPLDDAPASPQHKILLLPDTPMTGPDRNCCAGIGMVPIYALHAWRAITSIACRMHAIVHSPIGRGLPKIAEAANGRSVRAGEELEEAPLLLVIKFAHNVPEPLHGLHTTPLVVSRSQHAAGRL